MEVKLKTALKALRDVLAVQGSKGNWDYDPYMFGLFNGLALAESVMTGEEPEFKEAPPKWIGKTSKERAAEKLRKKNPALQQAYEEYKILEGLLMGTKDDPDID